MIAVSSVLRRSDQGVTHPFICIDESDCKLWVKGSAWSKTDLASEWICALLAREWGLPIALFELVNVSDDVLNCPLNKEIERMAQVLRRIESKAEQFWEATP